MTVYTKALQRCFKSLLWFREAPKLCLAWKLAAPPHFHMAAERWEDSRVFIKSHWKHFLKYFPVSVIFSYRPPPSGNIWYPTVSSSWSPEGLRLPPRPSIPPNSPLRLSFASLPPSCYLMQLPDYTRLCHSLARSRLPLPPVSVLPTRP